MGQTLTAASAVLKDDYQPNLREQLNNSFMLLDQIEKNTEDTVGTAAVIAIHVARSSGVGARPEGGTLPTAGKQGYANERITLKYNYGTIKVTGQTIKLMATDKGAFVRAVDSETKGITRDLKRDVNRQLYTPAAGTIGTTTASPGATTVTVNAKSTLRRIESGTVYDIVEAASDLVVRSVTAVSVALSTLTWTYTTLTTGTGTGASGNRIVLNGIVPSGLYEVTGLEDIVASSGTLHNVNPVTYPVWASYQASLASAALSDSALEEALDEIAIAGSSDPNLIISTHAIVRSYANSLKTLKRFNGESLVLKGGWKAVSVSVGRTECALMPERDCTESTVYLLSTENLVEFYASDWEWMDEDGAVLSRVSGTDSYEAVLFRYHELATDKRNAHGKLTSVG